MLLWIRKLLNQVWSFHIPSSMHTALKLTPVEPSFSSTTLIITLTLYTRTFILYSRKAIFGKILVWKAIFELKVWFFILWKTIDLSGLNLECFWSVWLKIFIVNVLWRFVVSNIGWRARVLYQSTGLRLVGVINEKFTYEKINWCNGVASRLP